MNATFLIEQLLNGLGYGLMLFMLAAGLTLVFGVMDTMNLAHGTLYMLGAYFAAETYARSQSFLLALVVAIVLTMVVGAILEVLLMRKLYARNHLNQVVATFGVILLADDLIKRIWGPSAVMSATPSVLSGPVSLGGDLSYAAYRLVLLGAGLLVAALLYVIVNYTRLGMLVRAGASNRQMAEMMGVRVKSIFTLIFVLGAALAGLAGALMGPLTSVQVGMGEAILIPALVVIVIGGIGSVRGCFVAALLVGLVDTAGRAFITPALRSLAGPATAADVGPALASVLMYLLMAAVLSIKPSGLFPARG